ncbi:hypothetical protein [Streptomyces sp. SPB162]|uniref:hypothetical protein n=1 Tax=Streptomyces sp. SPB162 TaxID=2940560 RepID=UPI002405C704|nr:hypothetical protein [Streptomyces sp. SPB162]MDF9811944.1 hypothetical protein [Streptomyces sp. SPB162]
MSETPAQRLLRNDPRTVRVAAHEAAQLPVLAAEALLRVLADGETVLAVYRDGWGYAALTGNGVILLPGMAGGGGIRVYQPLGIVRGAQGVFGSVTILVDGKRHRLWGSKLDPKGRLLESAGELLPSGFSAPPGRGARSRAWVRQHPVLTFLVVALLIVLRTGVNGLANAGSADEEKAAPRARVEYAVAVPAFQGFSLREAKATAGAQPWVHVSAADASSAFRTVTGTEAGWRVCFQIPARGETALPSLTTLTLYAVPDRETCPEQLFGAGRIVMPDLVGERFDAAAGVLGDLGLARTVLFHALTGRRLDGGASDHATWQVCRQQPGAGAEVSTRAQVSLWLIGSGDPCTAPSPSAGSAGPEPKPQPKPKPQADPAPSYGTSGGGGGSSRGGVRFGQFCSPVGGTATTADGRPAKCYMGKDGRARWSYYSG